MGVGMLEAARAMREAVGFAQSGHGNAPPERVIELIGGQTIASGNTGRLGSRGCAKRIQLQRKSNSQMLTLCENNGNYSAERWDGVRSSPHWSNSVRNSRRLRSALSTIDYVTIDKLYM